jgi:hypothetical protein
VAQVRFRGGATQTLHLPLPLPATELRKTPSSVVAEIDRLIDEHTDLEIAEILNARGLRPGVADRFTNVIICHIRQKYRLENRYSRLRRHGLLTLNELAAASGLHPTTVKHRAARGQLDSSVYNDKGQRLYPPLGQPVMITCGHCGEPTPERVRHGQRRKYCSVRCCMAAYHRRRAAGALASRFDNGDARDDFAVHPAD